ncbi:sialidase family protein [Streptomyces liangshanensis]|uniref:Exo-alpha-sialidase n=1 Tax=Streptomyces liangshanensis TaxID=2717324 RepID=A0A6G9H176_9ACTN|nr:sialidase family protein [Streptomyces liangshanensis]QIQ04283.1 exo-alpha-sialidase [Streptomyces liangshanensis]
MTFRRAWPVLLSVVVLAVLSGLLQPRPAAASAEVVPGESLVYTNRVSKGDGTRTPDIISTSADNAVVVWREGLRPGSVDMGYMRYSYTTDGGDTWSRPRTLAQETDQYAWHYVILYQAGSTLYAYLGRTPIADATEPDGINNNGIPINGTFLKRSTDQGHTWQDAPLTVPAKDNLILSGRPLQRDNGEYVMPYWSSGRENGVLISSDLQTWRTGGHISGNELTAGENQIGFSQTPQDAAHPKNSLVMVARAKSAGAATSTSTDGGASWTPFTTDTALPSYNIARSYFANDSGGQYLYIYNAGSDSSNRDVLDYKTKRPGAAWSAAKPFADGPVSDNTDQPDGKGWDNYPMADEYAPGKFWVVWEFDTTRIKAKPLDISNTP